MPKGEVTSTETRVRTPDGGTRVLPFPLNAKAADLSPEERAERDAYLRSIVTGRPPLDVLTTEEDWVNFNRLLTIQATQREVAAFFDCDEDTILSRVKAVTGMTYREYAARVKPKGTVSLRRKQIEMALKGDRTMLIWTGKQYLGQADKVDNQHTGPDGGPIQVEVSNPVASILEALTQIRERRAQGAETTATTGQIADNRAHPLHRITGGVEVPAPEPVTAETTAPLPASLVDPRR